MVSPILIALSLKILQWIRLLVDSLLDRVYGFIARNRPQGRAPPITNGILNESATSLAAKIRARRVSSESVIQAYIKRIREVNPIINAVVDERFTEALEEARAADRFVESGGLSYDELAERKPFLGVPFTTKDAIAVKGLKWTCGSVLRKDIVADEDAAVVKAMREAGAIPIAITNVPEMLLWWETGNRVFGRTKSPYDTSRTCGGSSGGEAALLGAAGSVVGIGNDIGGSIRVPSFYNGLFGHKPTAGTVSNEGQFPPGKGVVNLYVGTGPMCRYAKDLLPMYRVLSGPNSHRLKLDQHVDVATIKFYYMEDNGGNPLSSNVDKDVRAAIRKVVRHLESTYRIEVRQLRVEGMFDSTEIWGSKVSAETESNVTWCQLLTNLNGDLNPYTELVKYLMGLSNHTLPAIAAGLFEKIVPTQKGERFELNERRLQAIKKELNDTLRSDGVLLYPVMPRSAGYHHQHWFRVFDCGYPGIFNILGFPATACPVGRGKNGLPVGLQAIATQYNDHLTLAVARELESAFGGWTSPAAFP